MPKTSFIKSWQKEGMSLVLVIAVIALFALIVFFFCNTLNLRPRVNTIIPALTPSPTISSTLVPSTNYKCPENGWVDCMPTLNNAGIKWECTPDAQNWYRLNCPNFKGIAY